MDHIDKYLQYIEAKRALIDSAMTRYIQSAYTGELRSMVNYSIKSGKRIRGVLLLTLCDQLGADKSKALKLAVSTELGHAASLIHDDIIDNSEWRRSRPSLWKRYGIERSVVLPHMLIADALQLAYGVGDAYASISISAWQRASMGQYLDLQAEESTERKKLDYARLITLKTASLFECAAEMVATLAKANSKRTDDIVKLGTLIGASYQLCDDLVDSMDMRNRSGSTLAFIAHVDKQKTRSKLEPFDYVINKIERLYDSYVRTSSFKTSAELRALLIFSLCQKFSEQQRYKAIADYYMERIFFK